MSEGNTIDNFIFGVIAGIVVIVLPLIIYDAVSSKIERTINKKMLEHVERYHP